MDTRKWRSSENDHQAVWWRWEQVGGTSRKHRPTLPKMYQRIFAGLGQTAEEHLSKSFEIIDNNIWWLRRISSSIPCVSDHFLLFMEKVHVPYSNNVWLGGFQTLVRSKYIKTTKIQERLTVEIADTLMEYLGTRALVWVEQSMCVVLCGWCPVNLEPHDYFCAWIHCIDKRLESEPEAHGPPNGWKL